MNQIKTRRAFWAGLVAMVAAAFAFVPEAHAHEEGACHAKEGKKGSHGNKRFKKMNPAHLIERFDKNGDGVLEIAELPDLLRARIADADTNRDGKLSLDELKAHRTAWKGKHGKGFAHLDKNGDGVLTREEAGEKWERIAKADANKDGKVTKEELTRARAEWRSAKKAAKKGQ